MVESLERVDPTMVKVNVDIEWEDFERKYVESIRKVGGSVRIRGFRKGKAPISVLERLLGQEVKMEAAVESVSDRLKELVKRESLFPVREEYNIRENVVIEDRKGVRYSKELEVLPEIENLDFEGLELEEEKAIEEGSVDGEIRKLAARKAPVAKRPEGEASKEFDVVMVTGRVEFDDQALEPLELKEERMDIAPWSALPPELKKLLTGRKTGYKLKEKVSFPPGKETPQPAAATLTGRVSSVLGREIPAIDDELAKDYDFKSLEDMRKEVRKQLDQDAHQAWISRSGEKVLNDFVEKFDVPLPRSYKGIVEEKMSSAGEARNGKDKKLLKSDYEKEFKKFILTQVIALKNDLHISKEELQKNMNAMSSLIQKMNMEESKRKDFLKNWLREYEAAQLYKLINGFIVEKVAEGKKKKSQKKAEVKDEAKAESVNKSNKEGE